MSGMGTDVMAMACILGGAATAGAVTLALTGPEPEVAVAEPCFVELTHAVPRVVVTRAADRSGASTRVTVATPADPRAHEPAGCADAVVISGAEVRLDAALGQVRRARAEVGRVRVRVRADRAHLEEMRRALEERRAEPVEGERVPEAELEALEDEVERELEALMRRLEEQLDRVRREGGF